MALAVTISPEEVLEFKRDFEELMEAFFNTVLTQGQNVRITNLSRIPEHYIILHIYYCKSMPLVRRGLTLLILLVVRHSK